MHIVKKNTIKRDSLIMGNSEFRSQKTDLSGINLPNNQFIIQEIVLH